VEEVVRDEVADVGDHPAPARLDEEVVPETGDVLFDDVDLARQDLQKRLERAVVAVLLAVDRRQEGEEAGWVARRRHEARPPRPVRMTSRAVSSTVASSAGSTAPGFAGSGRAGSTRTCGCSGAGVPSGRRSTLGRSRFVGSFGCSSSMSAATTPSTSWIT